MKEEEFENLKVGEIVISKSSNEKYVVIEHRNNELILARTYISNDPTNWEKA